MRYFYVNYVVFKSSLLLLSFPLFYSCSNDQDNIVDTDAVAEQPFVELVCLDLSKSNTYIDLSPFHLKSHLLNKSKQGVTLYGISILSNSYRQTPYVSEPLFFDSIPEKGNYVTVPAIEKKNEEQRKQVQNIVTNEVIEFQEQIMSKRDQKFTDINNALVLAEKILTNSAYKHHVKRLVILSDMIQDTKSSNQLEHFQFSKGTEIYIIGKSPQVDISGVFEGASVTEVASFEMYTLLY